MKVHISIGASKIKKLLLVSLALCTILSGTFISVPVFAEEYEGAYLYVDAYYSGDWIRIGPDNKVYDMQNQLISASASDFSRTNYNDNFSSIRIVGNYQITVFQHNSSNTYQDGLSSLFKSNVDTLVDYGLNDLISSARIETRNTPGIYIYEHGNCQGRCFRLRNDYISNLAQYGFDKNISSIEYICGINGPESMNIVLYDNSYYSGSTYKVKLGRYSYTYNSEYEVYYVPRTDVTAFNDRASSIRATAH